MGHLISINGHTIRSNVGRSQRGEPIEPPIRVGRGVNSGAEAYASNVAIFDEAGKEVAWLEYQPSKAIMKCGARLVLRTLHDVAVTG